MAFYTTPASLSAGNTLTATHMNLLRTDFEVVAKPPLIRAYNTANQSIANGSNVAVVLNATYSVREMNLGANTITVAESGFYAVAINVQWATNATGTRVVRLKQNGTQVAEDTATPGNTTWRSQSLPTFVATAAADTFTLEVFQDSGGALNFIQGSIIAMWMVSRL